MMQLALGPRVLAVLAAGACGGGGSHPDAPAGNPRTLWLAPDGSEIHVKLIESEPPPF
jgi:hypothetical protein